MSIISSVSRIIEHDYFMSENLVNMGSFFFEPACGRNNQHTDLGPAFHFWMACFDVVSL